MYNSVCMCEYAYEYYLCACIFICEGLSSWFILGTKIISIQIIL